MLIDHSVQVFKVLFAQVDQFYMALKLLLHIHGGHMLSLNEVVVVLVDAAFADDH